MPGTVDENPVLIQQHMAELLVSIVRGFAIFDERLRALEGDSSKTNEDIAALQEDVDELYRQVYPR